jgi:hypothetical protein
METLVSFSGNKSSQIISKLTFNTVFNKVEDFDAGFYEVPANIKKAFGGKGRVKVHSWIGVPASVAHGSVWKKEALFYCLPPKK